MILQSSAPEILHLRSIKLLNHDESQNISTPTKTDTTWKLTHLLHHHRQYHGEKTSQSASDQSSKVEMSYLTRNCSSRERSMEQ